MSIVFSCFFFLYCFLHAIPAQCMAIFECSETKCKQFSFYNLCPERCRWVSLSKTRWKEIGEIGFHLSSWILGFLKPKLFFPPKVFCFQDAMITTSREFISSHRQWQCFYAMSTKLMRQIIQFKMICDWYKSLGEFAVNDSTCTCTIDFTEPKRNIRRKENFPLKCTGPFSF